MGSSPLNKNITFYRKQAGMTQEDLGRALFVTGQAVSRWERGGAPDVELLPRLADALGVSLDMLFGHETEQQASVETLVGQELLRSPTEQRMERAYQLAWHMMKVIASSYGEPGDSYFRAMTANENLDRRGAKVPEQVPVTNYFDMEEGLLQSCVARDFHYVLIMPEPECGYSSIMKNSEDYRRFFAFLAQEHCLDMLVLAYQIPSERNFTAAFAAGQLGITEEEADAVLEQMHGLHMLQRSEVQVSGGVLRIYARHDETLIIPFLYFAGEMMRNGREMYYSLPLRNGPVFKDPLGTDSLSPDWEPSLGPNSANPPFGAGFSGM